MRALEIMRRGPLVVFGSTLLVGAIVLACEQNQDSELSNAERVSSTTPATDTSCLGRAGFASLPSPVQEVLYE